MGDEIEPWVDKGWLDSVPGRASDACRLWRLELGSSVRSHVSRIFICRDASGQERVLKLAPPEAHPEREAAALTHWHGSGSPSLIAFAPELGALLLERISPGAQLPPAEDATAAPLVAATLRRLWSRGVPRSPFLSFATSLDEWVVRARASAEPGTAGTALLDRAVGCARALDAETTARVLLHGDFIDKNLLLGRDGYVAIDPIPSVGDPCSDVGFYAAYHPPASGITERARVVATHVGLDPLRATRWAAVWAVGEATQTWRADSDELQAWVTGRKARSLLED